MCSVDSIASNRISAHFVISRAAPLLALLCAWLLEVPAAARTGGGAPQQSFRVSSAIVPVAVTVVDGDAVVAGLPKEDFEIYEDGIRQEIQFFEAATVPLDVILLLDSSSSMRLEMPVVRRAARAFMNVLRIGDRGAVVGFTERVHVLQDLTPDRQAILRAIDATRANGSTALHNAIYIALARFSGRLVPSKDVRRQALVVLTDGVDTSSLISFEDLLDVTLRGDVTIYTIGLYADATADENPEQSYRLRRLARETGGRAFFPESVHELRRVYGRIAEELRGQYSLGYAPDADGREARVRQILVRLPNHPGLTVRARTGYFQPATIRSVGR